MIKGNPYVGPNSFGQENADLFFGRDREAQQLEAVVSSEEITLFYAQSGAGKTSLVNARLMPDLKKRGFEVRAVRNIGGRSRLAVQPANVFVFNILTSLAPEREPAELARCRLAELLQRKNGDRDAWGRLVVVVDQFEEIFTSYPDRRQDRADFFEQLQEAVDANPDLSVLLVIREDKIAGLDEFVPLVRNRLQARFRMETLSRESALEAIRRPAAEAGREFEDGLAEELVSHLSRVRVAGRDELVEGEHIEPLQLQVVCFELWESLPEGAEKITRADMEAFGDVDRALERFYRKTVEETARETGIAAEDVHSWFKTELITSQGLRGMVVSEGEQAGGLPAAAVAVLEKKHLIRAEVVHGGTWYQLIHDGFVAPILAAGASWPGLHHRLAADAQVWEEGDPSSLRAYSGRKLREVNRWAEAGPRFLADRERKFLAAAGRADRRRLRRLVAGLATMLIAVAGLLVALTLFHHTSVELAGAQIELGQETLEANPEKSLRQALNVRDHIIQTPATRRQAEVLLRDGLRAHRLRSLWDDKSGEVAKLAWSADGRRLATVSENGAVRIRDLGSGRLIAVAEEPGHIKSLAMHSDGTWLVFFDHRCAARLWDPSSGMTTPLPGIEECDDVALSPNGKWIVAAGRASEEAALWDAETLAPVARLALPHSDELPVFSFSRDGRCLAVTRGQTEILRWRLDAETQKPSSPEDVFEATTVVNTLALARDCTLMAAAGGQGLITLWEGEDQVRFSAEGAVEHLALSDDGDYLIASTTGGVRVWNVHSGDEVLSSAVARKDRVESRDELIAIPSPDGRFLLRQNQQGFEILEILFEDVETFIGHRTAVVSLAFDREGRRMATASADETVKLWDVATRQPLFSWDNQGSSPRVALSPDCAIVAGTSSEGLTLWDTDTGEAISAREEDLTAVAFRPDANQLAAGGRGHAFLWDAASHDVLRRYETGALILSLAFDPQGSLLAAALDDHTTVIFDVNTGITVERLTKIEAPTYAVAFSPAGSLATASGDGKVRIWDPSSGQLRETLENTSEVLFAVTFSPDGRQLAAVGAAGPSVWDPRSAKRLANFTRRPQEALDLAFAPAGDSLAVAYEDGTVRLEPLRVEDLVDLARARLAKPHLSEESK